MTSSPAVFLIAVCLLPVASDAPATYGGRPAADWIAQLASEDIAVRWHAAYALGQLGPAVPEAVDPLMKILENQREYEYVRGAAAWALGRIGPRAEPAVGLLTSTLASKHLSVRRAAPTALGEIGTAAKSAEAALAKAMADEDPLVRVHAAAALWKVAQRPPAIATLIEAVRSDRAAAAPAAAALGEIRPPTGQIIAALVEGLHSSNEDTRRIAARALGQIGQAAVAELKKVVAETRPEVRRGAAQAFGWMGVAAMPELIAALQNSDTTVRRIAIGALGRLGAAAKPAESALTELLADQNPEIRAAAGLALRRIRE